MFQLDPKLHADTLTLGALPVCQVLLMNESQFPWLILVPRRNDIGELFQLNSSDAEQVNRESLIVSRFLMDHFQGFKLNTGALGNLVPQLHIHHIVRFNTDAAWPKPVWGNFNSVPYSSKQLEQRRSELVAGLVAATKDFQPC